jgi:hypothetical protein
MPLNKLFNPKNLSIGDGDNPINASKRINGLFSIYKNEYKHKTIKILIIKRGLWSVFFSFFNSQISLAFLQSNR